jgi:hypothetical protein
MPLGDALHSPPRDWDNLFDNRCLQAGIVGCSFGGNELFQRQIARGFGHHRLRMITNATTKPRLIDANPREVCEQTCS